MNLHDMKSQVTSLADFHAGILDEFSCVWIFAEEFSIDGNSHALMLETEGNFEDFLKVKWEAAVGFFLVLNETGKRWNF